MSDTSSSFYDPFVSFVSLKVVLRRTCDYHVVGFCALVGLDVVVVRVVSMVVPAQLRAVLVVSPEVVSPDGPIRIPLFRNFESRAIRVHWILVGYSVARPLFHLLIVLEP